MQNAKIIFATTTRNPGKAFLKSLFQMVEIGKKFGDYRVIIVESDSSINLDKYFANISSNKKIIVKRLGSLKDKIEFGHLRTERIAFSRNTYINQILKSPNLLSFDYLAMYDSDGASRMITYDSLKTAIKIDIDWTAQFSNQLIFYYDIFALRAKGWVDENPKLTRKKVYDVTKNHKEAFLKSISSKMKHIPTNSSLISVESAFGSFGIYKVNDINNALYVGNNNGLPICEHVSFNLDLASNNKKLYINPALISSLGFPQHTLLPKILIYLIPTKLFNALYKRFGGDNKKFRLNNLFDYFG